jgi:FAD/FMN-containing dehydrogenase/Fe-S oxidoreductase
MLAAVETKSSRRRFSAKPVSKPDLNADGLARMLKKHVRGEVRFDTGSRALYATDGSNYRQVPIGVVIPKDSNDVIATVAACHKYGAPLLPRGAGTSLAGQCCNVAVVVDFTKYMNHILEIDTRRKLVRVEPGCVLDDLRNEAAKSKLTFGPDPSTHSHCALGGMLGNNSCGVHSLLCRKNGIGLRTSDNTHELEVLTYDGDRMRVGAVKPAELERIALAGNAQGRIYERLRNFRDRYENQIRNDMPRLPRRVSGYNLNDLLPENDFNIARSLIGSEGTLVTILEATLMLIPRPTANSLVVMGYPDVYSAADHLMEILDCNPIGLEGLDHLLIEWIGQSGKHKADLKLLPKGNGFLLVQFGGETKEDADNQARRCMERLKKAKNPPNMKLFDEPEQEEHLWKIRESGLAATAWVAGHPDSWPGFEDSAVPPEKVSPYLHDLRDLMQRYGYEVSLYGHFGQGCIHCRIPFDLYTAPGVKKFEGFMDEATDLVVKYGGSISGEHGDGQARAAYIHKMFGPELMEAFREFKRIWDPHWKMNPGKVIDAYSPVENLRIGPDYNPPSPKTHFAFESDKGSFARAALRCVGIGECRKKGGQTMCPSYMATMEEEHSTRGRARMLWEMLNGAEITDGWKSDAVKQSLDLCLSCKGCKSDCPVNVDMATYKAEFLSHYYKGRLKPRHAYIFGLIHVWARLAAVVPSVANFFLRAPGFSRITKWVSEVQPERKIPIFAPQSFKKWFKARSKVNRGCPPVVLWADTFNNYYHPDVANAAVEVLEHAGYQVIVPMADMCCGRPLFDYGMLDTVERWLKDILGKLRPAIQAGVPIIVLEPSCCAVFRDELTNLFPTDLDAKRLQESTFLLSEFLHKKARGYKAPKLKGHAIVHGHCHQKALMGMESENALLKEMGLDYKILESGCCGMAGAFGYERGDHYDVSIKCGERVLLPEVRNAADGDLIVADGFSCKEQIAQETDREALHIAQVLQMGIKQHTALNGERRPEQPVVRQRAAEQSAANLKAAVVAAAVGALGLALWRLLRERPANVRVSDRGREKSNENC